MKKSLLLKAPKPTDCPAPKGGPLLTTTGGKEEQTWKNGQDGTKSGRAAKGAQRKQGRNGKKQEQIRRPAAMSAKPSGASIAH